VQRAHGRFLALEPGDDPGGEIVRGQAAAGRRDVALGEEGLLFIEDASYAYLASEPPPPLAALAPEATVYVSGLSKSVATGLRVGFVAAPAPVVPAIERAIRATTWNTPALTTAIACRWLEDGTVNRLEARKRDDARTRQAIARHVLAGLPQISHPSSYFTWLPLPEGARADRVAASLSRDRISVATAEPFATAFRLVGPRSALASSGTGTPVIARTRSTARSGCWRISSSGASWVAVIMHRAAAPVRATRRVARYFTPARRVRDRAGKSTPGCAPGRDLRPRVAGKVAAGDVSGGFREQEHEFHAVLEEPEFDFERVRYERQDGGGFKDHLGGQPEFFQVCSLEFVNCWPGARIFVHVHLSGSCR
jgi:hypothetical protein